MQITTAIMAASTSRELFAKPILRELSSSAWRWIEYDGSCHSWATKSDLLLTMRSLWRSDLEGGVFQVLDFTGAGEAIRTPDPNLGKVMLYP